MKTRYSSMVSIVLCVLGLFACDDQSLVWSPDGQHMAFVGSDGLRFGDSNGKLSPSVPSAAARVAWLPDSKHVLIAGSFDLATWSEAKKFYPEQNQKEVIDLANYILEQLEHQKFESFMDNDKRLKSVPDRTMHSAFLYLRENSLARLKQLTSAEIFALISAYKLKINTISLLDTVNGSEATELWRGLEEIADARISPDGKYVLYAQPKDDKSESFNLEMMPLLPGSPPIKICDAASLHSAWTADSKKVIFVEGLDSKENPPVLGALSSITVRANDGTVLEKIAEPTRLLYLAVDKSSDIRCLKDSRIIFSSAEAQMPATKEELSVRDNVFAFKAGDQFARPLMSVADTYRAPSIDAIQISPDENWVTLWNSGSSELRILNLATGHVNQCEVKPNFEPSWRTNDQVCYAKPIREKKKNQHDAEIVLHNVSNGTDLVISEDWPESAVDDFLVHKKKK